MAWNPQGGGQGPWGSGPKGPVGPQPPDIEEMFRRGQSRLKSIMPGGMGTAQGIVLAVLAALVLWLGSGFYRVETGQQGAILLFGEFVQTADPGLRWYFPSPIGTVLVANVEGVRRVDIGYRTSGDPRRGGTKREVPEESLMLTGDQNIADLDFMVQWKVQDTSRFLFNIRDPESTVKSAAESAMREIIGQVTLQFALTEGRRQIAQKTHNLLQSILDSYGAGITITRVELLVVDPPATVIDSFNEVQRARQDKVRKQNEAQAYRNKIVPTARGEAEKIIQQAAAYQEKIVKEAEGEAERFISVYEAYKGNKEVTALRLYLERMQEVLKNSEKVIIDTDGSGSGVVPYLPLPELKKRNERAN